MVSASNCFTVLLYVLFSVEQRNVRSLFEGKCSLRVIASHVGLHQSSVERLLFRLKLKSDLCRYKRIQLMKGLNFGFRFYRVSVKCMHICHY